MADERLLLGPRAARSRKVDRDFSVRQEVPDFRRVGKFPPVEGSAAGVSIFARRTNLHRSKGAFLAKAIFEKEPSWLLEQVLSL